MLKEIIITNAIFMGRNKSESALKERRTRAKKKEKQGFNGVPYFQKYKSDPKRACWRELLKPKAEMITDSNLNFCEGLPDLAPHIDFHQ